MTDHEILGISIDADPAEIKRAYRRMAMRWHPDRNPHPEAAERFKEIRAAYDALMSLDEDEDSLSADENQTPNSSDSQTVRAADIRLNIQISLVEAFSGCLKSISYQRAHTCSRCAGTGEYGMSRTRFCAQCHGSGRVRDTSSGLKSCDACDGRGFFVERICPDCAGDGKILAEVHLEVKIPPGMLSGDDLRLSGQGQPETDTLAAGDLFLTVIIQSDPYFELKGRDLYLEMPVNALLLLAGGPLDVPLPVDGFSLELESGEMVPRTLCLAERGFPASGKKVAGDFYLTLQPVFPTQLTAKQKKTLSQLIGLVEESRENHLPQLSSWWAEFRAGDVAEN